MATKKKMNSLDDGYFRIFSPNGYCFEIRVERVGPEEVFLRIHLKGTNGKWGLVESFTQDDLARMLNKRKGYADATNEGRA